MIEDIEVLLALSAIHGIDCNFGVIVATISISI